MKVTCMDTAVLLAVNESLCYFKSLALRSILTFNTTSLKQ